MIEETAVEPVKVKRKRAMSKRHRERLELIRDLYFVKKMSGSEIAGITGVGKNYIYQDIKLLRNRSEEEGRKSLEEINNPAKFLMEMKINYHERIRKLWEVFNNCNPRIQEDRKIIIQVQEQIMKQERFFLDYLQDVGAVSRKQDKPSVGNINYISLTGKERVSLKGKQLNIEQGEVKDETIEAIVSDGSSSTH